MHFSDHNDDAELLGQTKLLYYSLYRLIRLIGMFNKCSDTIHIELCKGLRMTFYCPYF